MVNSSGIIVARYQYDPYGRTTLVSGSNLATFSGSVNSTGETVTVNSAPQTLTSGTNFSTNIPLPTGTNVVTVVAQDSGTNTRTNKYKVVVSGTPTILTYDNNGNCTKDENGNTYTWDVLNRLTKITYPSTAYTTFAYDGLSRRTQIAEYDSSHTLITTKNYLWVGSEIAEERDASNTVQKQFYAQGEKQGSTLYYYTRDHERSVREMVDSSGTLVFRLSYDPYGRITNTSGTNSPIKEYGGYYCHALSGLSFTRFRAYDSNTGRWLSRDPIAEFGGIDLYGYVDNDPIDWIDKLGLWKGGYKSYLDAAHAGATADLEWALSVDPTGQGPEASGLVCRKMDGSDYGYTGPNHGEVGVAPGAPDATTWSNPSKEPCPPGYCKVGVHYAHPSGRGIPPFDKHVANQYGVPFMLATPSLTAVPNFEEYNPATEPETKQSPSQRSKR